MKSIKPNQHAEPIKIKLREPYINVEKQLPQRTPPVGREEPLRIIPSKSLLHFEEYLRNIRNQEIIPPQSFHKEIRVQYNDFSSVFFVEIGQRLAKKSRNRVNYKEIENNIINKNERILIVGEAGIGKTTLCHALKRNLSQLNGSKKIIPLITLLRNKKKDIKSQSEINLYRVLDYDHDLTNIEQFKDDERIIFVLIFDGLNEIDDDSRKKIIPTVNEFSKKFSNISVIFTSRSVRLSEELCQLVDNLRIYEIQRWTKKQLIEYFRNNSIDNTVSSFTNLSEEMKNALRLPLFAWIFLQTESLIRLHTSSISDIFDDFLHKCINISKEDKPELRNTNTNYPINEKERIQILYDLAYTMTKQETLTITSDKIYDRFLKQNDNISPILFYT